jgi:hypothetical protein
VTAIWLLIRSESRRRSGPGDPSRSGRLRPTCSCSRPAVTLAGVALAIGIPAGIFCGRVRWLIFAHQLGITPVLAVPSVELPVLAAGWLAAAVVIAALPAEAAVRSRPARILRSE